MKLVKIIKGTYGHKKPGFSYIEPVGIGQTVEVDDSQAERLVNLGVAEIIEEAELPFGDEPEELPEEVSEEEYPVVELEENFDLLTKRELAERAEAMGITVTARMSKADIIELIRG